VGQTFEDKKTEKALLSTFFTGLLKARRRLLALKGHSPECFLGDAKLKATGCHKKEKNLRQSTRLGVY
jgi:hypothetical protein